MEALGREELEWSWSIEEYIRVYFTAECFLTLIVLSPTMATEKVFEALISAEGVDGIPWIGRVCNAERISWKRLRRSMALRWDGGKVLYTGIKNDDLAPRSFIKYYGGAQGI